MKRIDEWQQLMQAAQNGSEASYGELLTDVAEALRIYFKKRIHNETEIEDLVQEVLLGLHKARHTFDPKQPFAAWMYSIARYKMIDYFRKHKKQADWIPLEDLGDDHFASEMTNSEQAEQVLKEALQQLPEKQRLAFISLKLDGHSIKETAEKYNVTESAIKVSAHRAYKFVHKYITDHGGG